ncbi:unnamed protein product, partial [Onchocerca flexuosa]|uniref:CCDC92 domain-containing protein n=1 Tax=Onchocerca flexuosa TaxID=387005 RepID=A0A183HBS0_9BILA
CNYSFGHFRSAKNCRLEIAQQNTDKLNQKLEECEKKSRDLEQQTNETIKVLKNQLSYQGNRIRQLSDELRERTAQISKLMAQLPSGTIAETTETARNHSHSQPNIHWNPAPAPFFGKKDSNLSYMVRNVSITYPGGRPNVVAQRYSYTSSMPRSHHLPSLYSKPRSVPSSGNSIEKPIRLQMLSLQDRILIARSLYELQNSFMANSTTSSNSTNSKVSIMTDKSMQNTI